MMSSGNTTAIATGGVTTNFIRETQQVTSAKSPTPKAVSQLPDTTAAGNITNATLPGGSTIEYIYNDQGQPTQITLPTGAEHTFSYDSQGRATSFISPLGDSLRVSYEYAEGRRSRISQGDGTEALYGYTQDRLSSITTSDGTLTINRGAATGLLDQLTATGNYQLDYAYDTNGRLLTSLWSGVIDGQVTRTYDNRGRVNSFTVNETPALGISYNADDLVTQSGSMTITRDPATGRPVSSILGNCEDTWTYNTFSELIAYSASVNGNTVYSLTLTRDDLGRVLSKIETIEGTGYASAYQYNTAGQLSQETRDGLVTSYTYDANGNRLSRSVSGGSTEVATYNAGDQLITYAGTSYSYDAGGHLSARGTDTFNYNVLGGLQSANLASGSTLTYLHPLGTRRLAESIDGTTTRQFLYSGGLTIAGELDATGTVRSVFGYSVSRGAPDFIERDGRTYRIISDDLGSPRLVVDCNSGQVAQRMRHDAYGRVLEDTAPRFQPFGFAGGLYDPASGWVRFGARDYDSLTGRWTAPDPLLFDGSLINLYAYASGDPVNFIDRNGLEDSPSTEGECPSEGGLSVGSKCLADFDPSETDFQLTPRAAADLAALGARTMTTGGTILLSGNSDEQPGLFAHETVHHRCVDTSAPDQSDERSARVSRRRIPTSGSNDSATRLRQLR